MSQRVGWVDVARGIGIAMVVFSHSWRGLHDAGLIVSDTLFRDLDLPFYLVHMPLFFMLSGLLNRAGFPGGPDV